ncbi:MAG TPA: DUF6798 domain-containing protein [Anaerolineaceae bacterium]
MNSRDISGCGITLVSDFARTLGKPTLRRHLVFVLGACVAVLLSGYHFGTFDQIVHISFLKKFADPHLYPNDPFMDLRQFHTSYFWFLFLPFYRLGILEPILFCVHLAATYITYWMFWNLCDTLFHHPLTNLIAILALTFPHIGFPGFQMIEFSLLNRTFVLPFLLLAMNLYLRKKKLLAFAILGILYNLHALSVHFVLAMFLWDGVLRIREKESRAATLAGVAIFLVGALPVFLWLSDRASIDFSLRPDLLHAVSSATMLNIFYIIAPSPFILLDTLNGLGTLLCFTISRRRYPADMQQVLDHFVGAIGIILLVEVITTYLLPVTVIIQSQIARVGVFLQIFGYIYFSHLTAREIETARLPRWVLSLIAGIFITYFSALPALLLWGVRRKLGSRRLIHGILLAALLGLLSATIVVGRQAGYWSPGLHIYGPVTSWEDAQRWAQQNTPVEARFITPPHIYGMYTSDWRVFSERSPVVTIPELMEVIFAPQYLPDWLERLDALAPGASAQFNGNSADTVKFVREAFYANSPGNFRKLAKDYQAQYLVIEKPHIQPFKVVYENEDYLIYDLR